MNVGIDVLNAWLRSRNEVHEIWMEMMNFMRCVNRPSRPLSMNQADSLKQERGQKTDYF